MINILENIFPSSDWEGEIEKLTIKIENHSKCEYSLEGDRLFIENIRKYVDNLIKLICWNSDWEEDFDYGDKFKFIYPKIGLMRAHSVSEQESIYKIIRKINNICDKYKCEKIKDANGHLI